MHASCEEIRFKVSQIMQINVRVKVKKAFGSDLLQKSGVLCAWGIWFGDFNVTMYQYVA